MATKKTPLSKKPRSSSTKRNKTTAKASLLRNASIKKNYKLYVGVLSVLAVVLGFGLYQSGQFDFVDASKGGSGSTTTATTPSMSPDATTGGNSYHEANVAMLSSRKEFRSPIVARVQNWNGVGGWTMRACYSKKFKVLQVFAVRDDLSEAVPSGERVASSQVLQAGSQGGNLVAAFGPNTMKWERDVSNGTDGFANADANELVSNGYRGAIQTLSMVRVPATQNTTVVNKTNKSSETYLAVGVDGLVRGQEPELIPLSKLSISTYDAAGNENTACK